MKNNKLLIDGNIILDVLEKRAPFYKDSSMVWRLCETGMFSGCVSALTFADIVYIMRKELKPDDIVKVLDKLELIFKVEDLLFDDLKHAAKLGWKDYEDAVQAVIAERIGAGHIVTRNIKDYRDSEVPAVSPEEILTLI